MFPYAWKQAARGLENKKLASIPILALTANAFEEDRQEVLKCGMNGHIAKPIDVEKLICPFPAISVVNPASPSMAAAIS